MQPGPDAVEFAEIEPSAHTVLRVGMHIQLSNLSRILGFCTILLAGSSVLRLTQKVP